MKWKICIGMVIMKVGIEAREELQCWVREQIDIATQQAYDEGIVAGKIYSK